MQSFFWVLLRSDGMHVEALSFDASRSCLATILFVGKALVKLYNIGVDSCVPNHLDRVSAARPESAVVDESSQCKDPVSLTQVASRGARSDSTEGLGLPVWHPIDGNQI